MTHSATVLIRFRTADTTYEVSQTGEDSFILREPVTLPAGVGKLFISVDGNEFVYQIGYEAIDGRVVRYTVRGDS